MVQFAAILVIIYLAPKVFPAAFAVVWAVLPWAIGLVGWITLASVLWAAFIDHNRTIGTGIVGIVGLIFISLAGTWLEKRGEDGFFWGEWENF